MTDMTPNNAAVVANAKKTDPILNASNTIESVNPFSAAYTMNSMVAAPEESRFKPRLITSTTPNSAMIAINKIIGFDARLMRSGEVAVT